MTPTYNFHKEIKGAVLMKKFLNKLKEGISSIFSACLRKVRFFNEKRFLLFAVAINIVFLFLWIALYLQRHTIPWTVAIGFPLVSTAMCFAWYIQELLSWYHTRKHGRIEKTISVANGAFIFFLPVISFFISTNLAKLYFEKPLSALDIICCCVFAAFHFLYVFYYCAELKDITRPQFPPSLKAKFFVACIIHIVQLFADVYIILFILCPHSFNGIDTSSAFTICFDFTYFSAMTLLTASGELIAVSRLAKTVVLIETFIFVIVISMVIFGIFSNNIEVKNGDNAVVNRKEDS